MQLEEALKLLATSKDGARSDMPEFFEEGEYGEGFDDFDEEAEEIVDVTEEELLRFLDDQLPPLVVRALACLCVYAGCAYWTLQCGPTPLSNYRSVASCFTTNQTYSHP